MTYDMHSFQNTYVLGTIVSKTISQSILKLLEFIEWPVFCEWLPGSDKRGCDKCNPDLCEIRRCWDILALNFWRVLPMYEALQQSLHSNL